MGLKGRDAFDAYYREIFGAEWDSIYRSLMGPRSKVAVNLEPSLSTYELDPASEYVGKLIQAEPGDHILDMCAAPGGKSLCILKFNTDIELTANDMSQNRVARLKRVFSEHAPKDMLARVHVWSGDANRFGLRAASEFDWVLLDAPCSGERHLLESQKDLSQWSLKRTKGLAKRQYSLLCAALLALKPGGRVVYSTCTLSPLENDGVIDRLVKKKSNMFKLCELPEVGMATDYGRQFRPDLHEAWGPMYFTVLERTDG